MSADVDVLFNTAATSSCFTVTIKQENDKHVGYYNAMSCNATFFS